MPLKSSEIESKLAQVVYSCVNCVVVIFYELLLSFF